MASFSTSIPMPLYFINKNVSKSVANVSTHNIAAQISNKNYLDPALNTTLDVFYYFVCSLGIFSNGLVISLFIGRYVKASPFNILLLNLSIADFLAGVTVLPYVAVDLKDLRKSTQNEADMICSLTIGLTFFWIATAASTLTLTMISISRYVFIRYPLRMNFFNSRTTSVMAVIIIWIISTAIVIPNIFTYKYNASYTVCERTSDKNVSTGVFMAFTASLCFFLPMTAMAATFFSTRRYLWSTRNRQLGGGALGGRPAQSVVRCRKAALLLGGLVIAFFVFWAPFLVYLLLSRTATSLFPQGIEGEHTRMKALRFIVLICLGNSIADPVIYVFRGDSFRKAIKSIFSFPLVLLSDILSTRQ